MRTTCLKTILPENYVGGFRRVLSVQDTGSITDWQLVYRSTVVQCVLCDKGEFHPNETQVYVLSS